MIVNYEQIERNQGINFESIEQIYFYIKNLLMWLECHNKNYTKEQYYKICTLLDIMEAIEI